MDDDEYDEYGSDAKLREAAGQYRAHMEYVRAMGTSRRNPRSLAGATAQATVGANAKDEDPIRYEMPGYVAWALEHRSEKFTPAQRQALELWAGPELLTQEQMAERAGCPTRSAFRKRLAGAQRALAIVLVAEAQGRPSTVRRGKNLGRATRRTSGS